MLATRNYIAGSRVITAALYKPVKAPPDKWRVDFEIRGLEDRIQGHVIGVDRIQALELGIQGIRLKLEGLDVPFKWYVDGEVGFTGIARLIPYAFGQEFSEHAERLVNEALTKYINQAIREGRNPGSQRLRKK